MIQYFGLFGRPAVPVARIAKEEKLSVRQVFRLVREGCLWCGVDPRYKPLPR